ncbi:MAG: bifunctional pyr operon transcriptional regulator/uracil phosphoribosyltransferase PyrR [Mariprofundaceae bacterium]
MSTVIFTASDIEAAMNRMISAIKAENVYLIGIQRGGAMVADSLQCLLLEAGCNVERGNLDIGLYRDDLDTIGYHPEVHPSHLPFDMDGKNIWLIDDVLYTGRTIRAALGEIFDYGRPASIKLAVLLDRGGRELPLAADITGLYHETPHGILVKLICETDIWHFEQQGGES